MTEWEDLGPAGPFKEKPLSGIEVGGEKLALSYLDGRFSAIGGTCAHMGGPLSEGDLEGSEIVCPWHQWHFDCRSGKAVGQEASVGSRDTREEDGRLLVSR